MSPLSPAAQVVRDAYEAGGLPAALEAAADQVVPDSDAMRSPCREHCVIGGAAARIRAKLLAIAAELRGTNNTSQEDYEA